MATDPNPNPLTAVTGALESVLEIAGASRVVDACNRLAEALKATSEPPDLPLPEGVRPDIHRLVALLGLPTWQDVVTQAARLGVDLRDLTTTEFAYLERVGEKSAAAWRSNGTGPVYRCEARILYPVADYYEWRRKGRQKMVAQKARKGRR